MDIAGFDELVSFSDAAKTADRLVAVLERYGIEVSPSSELERQLSILRRLGSDLAGNTNWGSFREDLQAATGTLFLASLVCARANHKEFQKLLPHLRLINNSNPAPTVRTDSRDQNSDKVLELLIALAALGLASDIEVDDPVVGSGGRNPDVLARMPDGRLWGFACKAIHGDSPRTLFDRLREGIQQIEVSAADIGAVVIGFKDRMPHEEIFPAMGGDTGGPSRLGVYESRDAVYEDMQAFVRHRVQAMITEVTPEEVWRAVKERKGIPGFVTPLMTCAGIRTQAGPTASFVGVLRGYSLRKTSLVLPTQFGEDVESLLGDLNGQFRLRGFPRFPSPCQGA